MVTTHPGPKYIFDELNVVDMGCWINSHQEKTKKKSWHPCRNEPKHVDFLSAN
jgi:hypothetical protein